MRYLLPVHATLDVIPLSDPFLLSRNWMNDILFSLNEQQEQPSNAALNTQVRWNNLPPRFELEVERYYSDKATISEVTPRPKH